MKKWLSLSIGLALVCLIMPAAAKVDPYVEDGDWRGVDAPYVVWDDSAAVGLFGKLAVYGDVDAFAYTFDEPREGWTFEVMVPTCGPHFEAAYPSVAVIGPGFDAPLADTLPFSLPDGMGAQIFTAEHTEPREIAGSGEVSIPIPFEVYRSARYQIDIPETGTYTLALWEPDGHIGAYILATGDQHDKFADRQENELQASFDAMMDGVWLDQNCSLPLAAENCPATSGERGDAQIPVPPPRWDTDDGFALTGIVRDATTCLPIPQAEITFWMANESGEYDGVGEGRLLTNRQGGYRIEGARPVGYDGVVPHIHIAVDAPGYGLLVTEYLLNIDDTDLVHFDINISPHEG